MLENLERSVCGVWMGKSKLLEHMELANQIQGFRILDHWDASEKNNMTYSIEKNRSCDIHFNQQHFGSNMLVWHDHWHKFIAQIFPRQKLETFEFALVWPGP